MPRAYSVDLRERALRAMASGMPMTEVAARFDVSLSSLSRWKDRKAAGRSLAPGQSSGRHRAVRPAQEVELIAQVQATPDATLARHCARWEQCHGVRISSATMSRTLIRLGLALRSSR
jgi:putative transposase